MKNIPKIILVDDHTLFREGIRLLIEKEKLGQIIGEAANGEEFMDLLQTSSNPDLILMDLEMPRMNGYEATKNALLLNPDLKILVLTMLDGKNEYEQMINAGVMGFVLKSAGIYELRRAITTVLNGENFYSYEILQKVVSQFMKQSTQIAVPVVEKLGLSKREMEVLELFCKGMTTTEIADKLNRSIKTIESHRSSLLMKTNTKNTVNLVLYALKNKLAGM